MSKVTRERLEKIFAKFQEATKDANCVVCGYEVFKLFNGVVPAQLQSMYPNNWLTGRGDGEVVCLPMVCERCGNTLLIHVDTLMGGEDW